MVITKYKCLTTSILIFVGLFFCSRSLLGQDIATSDRIYQVIPPSPTAFELGKYGQIITGLYTGSAQYNIPLYTLKAKDHSLPISLSYSSNGIQVGLRDSWVGNGWSLNAGGVITRIVRGAPDDLGTQVTKAQILSSDSTTRANAWNLFFPSPSKNLDTEPDLYSFNFNGYSGKFIFTSHDNLNGWQAMLIPFQDLKIEYHGGSIFTITISDGTKYIFDQPEETDSRNNHLTSPSDYVRYNSAYYLSKILYRTGEEIDFTYINGFYVDSTPTSNTLTVLPVGAEVNSQLYCSGLVQVPGLVLDWQDLKIYPKHLSTISTQNILITLYASKSRPDIDDYRLDSLNIHDKCSSVPDRSVVLGYNTTANQHIFLTSVKESGNKVHTFNYESKENVPTGNSYAIDHWGYYNGVTANKNTIPNTPMYSSYFFSSDPPANRDPNPAYAIFGLLNTITYPTGGITQIIYEPHYYWDNTLNANVITGGMRVKRTVSTTSSNDPNPEIVRYYYADMQNIRQSSGSKPTIPTYFFKSFQLVHCTPGSYNGWGWCPCAVNIPLEICNCDQEVTLYNYTSNNVNQLYNSNSYHIGYTSVIKSYGEHFENGGEYFKYINVSPEAQATMVWDNGRNGFIPFATSSNATRNNGLILEEGAIKINPDSTFTTLKRVGYSYNIGTVDNRKYNDIEPIIVKNREVPQSNINLFLQPSIYYDIATYKVETEWPYLSGKTEIIYDTSGQNPVTKTEQFFYDNVYHAQLTREKTWDSKGNIIQKYLYYPADCDSTKLNFRTLNTAHIVNIPVDIRKYVNGKLAEGQQIKYNNFGQPADIYMAETNGVDVTFTPSNPYTFTHKATYLYDVFNNLNQVTKDYNVPTTYLWSYNNTLPVVKVENATYSQVSTSLTPSFITTLGSTISQTSVSTQLSQLRSTIGLGLPNARTSTYTYSPLVGMTSQTDPSGVTTYYEYDLFDRLKNVRDKDQNIFSRNYYHYYSDPSSDAASLTVSTSSISLVHTASGSSFTITANCSWTVASSSPGWLTVTPTSGTLSGSVTVNATLNSSLARTATLTITYGNGLTTTVTVLQAAGTADLLSVGTTEVDFLDSVYPQNVSVNVFSNVSWTVTSSSWITVSPVNGNSSILITVGKFPSGGRSGTVTLTTLDGAVSVQITVLQGILF